MNRTEGTRRPSKNMSRKSELIVITETKRLIDYMFVITEKSPKKYRYSFVSKIHNLLFEIIELLYEANDIDVYNIERYNRQKKVLVKYKLLDYLCDLAQKEKCILFNQYENITLYINNCVRLIDN